ncbi:helix-turn-helix domain-containing protein [Virgibacillus halophilus]|uniref:Helix-turn-helix domain-containing protein n=1 Tax=Tigheibacillus halophilus TaxID=361280 RepID=A0ABU5C922_9BACI|nr:helix-turn-helix domain-containing protein [Virgibacillus halophilus]
MKHIVNCCAPWRFTWIVTVQKKETAEKLFIVRQTLYHRLKKIGELIGSDFMKPDNRLALEMAIKAFYMKDAIKND